MAYAKKKKKFHIETPQERVWIEEKLNAYKKWNKPYKGEIVYKREGSSQEYIRRSTYTTYDELNADAKKLIEDMEAIDDRKWILVSTKIIGQSIDDDKNA